MRLLASTAIAAALALPALAQNDQTGSADLSALDSSKVVSLDQWNYGEINDGTSAEMMLDEYDIRSQTGDEIGDLEDIIIGAGGEVLSIVGEVGGVWDLGDTHVSVPWNEVTINDAQNAVEVPLTEDNIEDYDSFVYSGLAESQLGDQATMGVDDLPTDARAWRVSELIGDYARLKGAEGMTRYGYVSDVILKDGKIAATVVEADEAFGGGYYAYPFYGYDAGYGWDPADPYYELPYTEDEVAELDEFEIETE